MRIAIVSEEGLPPERISGAGIFIKRIAESLVKVGHQVEVFVPAEKAQGYLFALHAVKPFGEFWDGFLSAAMAYPVIYRRLLGALRQGLDHQFDILYAHNPFMAGRAGGKIAMARGIPAVLHYHFAHTPNNYLKGIKYPLSEMVARLGMNGYQKIVVTSQMMRRSVSHQFRLPEEKIEIVPLFVDTREFSPDIACSWVRERFAIPAGAPLVLFVGQVRKFKGIHILLKAAAQVLAREEIYLLVAGTGPFLESARRMSRELGIAEKVRFAGAVPAEELPAIYSASDIVVYPGFDDCYSLVVLEAASSGKAIIGTDHPIMLEEFAEGGKAAAIHHLGDAASLADAIVRLVRHPEERQALGQRARRKVVERYAREVVAAEMLRLFEKVKAEYA